MTCREMWKIVLRCNLSKCLHNVLWLVLSPCKDFRVLLTCFAVNLSCRWLCGMTLTVVHGAPCSEEACRGVGYATPRGPAMGTGSGVSPRLRAGTGRQCWLLDLSP